MATLKCIGCDTPIPLGATNCPMCGAKVKSATISIPPDTSKQDPIIQPATDAHQNHHTEQRVEIKNLIKCKECGNEVSSVADKCPHCGAKVKKGIGCIGLIGVFILIGMLGGFFSESNKTNSTSSPSTSNVNVPPKAKTPEELTVSAQAEIFCQQVNRTGKLENANEFTKSTNKLFKSKGIKMTFTVKDISTRAINFCKESPYGTTDDIIEHFIQISDVLSHYEM